MACVNIGAEEGIHRLKERSPDIVVSVLDNETPINIDKTCSEYRIKYVLVRQIPICIRLRKDHPLMLNSTRNSRNYPFGYSYIISVDELQTRLQTIAATNGFSIGCPTLRSYSEAYNLVKIPIKGEMPNLIYMVRNGDEDIPSITGYVEFLKDEVDSILKSPT